jgi:hypothetical protein
MLTLGGLGRPEVWPFLGVYSLWAWRAVPSMRRTIAWGLVLQPLFWFGIPALTAKSAFIAGTNALHSPREITGNKFTGTINRYFQLHEAPMWIAALLGTGLALYRRDRFPVLLAGAAVAWLFVEIAFALHGWPAVPRYLFESVAVACVLAGYFVGRVILELPPLLRRMTPRLNPRLIGWTTGVVVLLFVGENLPAARSRYRIEHRDLTHERARAREINRLSTVVSRLGVSRILACGQPNMPIGYQSVLAWDMGIKIGFLYINPNTFRLHPHTIVNFYPIHNGWKVFASHVDPAHTSACGGIHLVSRS